VNAEGTPGTLGDTLLGEIIRALLRRWWIPTLAVLVCGGLAVFYALNAPRVYRAEVLLAPATEERVGLGGGDLARFASQFSGIASLVGLGGGGTGTSKEIALATLTSRGFQASLVEELGLMRVFFEDRWDAETSSFRPSWTGAVPTVDDAIKYLNDRVFSVSEDRKTGLLRLRIEWYDRKVAADWANEIVRRVNESMRAQASSEAKRSLEFLQAELKRTTNLEVQRSIYSLMEAQVNRIMLANVREQYAFRVLDPAVPPAERNSVRPRKARIVLIGLMAGTVLGIGLTLLLELMRPRRKAPAEGS
jgi:uncharacterized protein involved in exopolysaccharide biosynthesis